MSASPYRLTRVVHDLRSGAFRRLPHRQRQIVNNSAATKTLSVDKSARLIFFNQKTRTDPPRICIASSLSTTLTRASDGPGALPFDKRILICRRVFNASTIRLSQNGSNACSPTNADQLNTKKKATPMNQNNQNQSFAAFIGLDKSDKKINLSLQRCGAARIERALPHDHHRARNRQRLGEAAQAANDQVGL